MIGVQCHNTPFIQLKLKWLDNMQDLPRVEWFTVLSIASLMKLRAIWSVDCQTQDVDGRKPTWFFRHHCRCRLIEGESSSPPLICAIGARVTWNVHRLHAGFLYCTSDCWELTAERIVRTSPKHQNKIEEYSSFSVLHVCELFHCKWHILTLEGHNAVAILPRVSET
jgi:hypothetical protein